MKISFVLYIICMSCFCTFVGANTAENYYFRHYTNKDGLSHYTVYCSLQDKKGFMWFGTDDGLNRFDGYSFRVFRHQANFSCTKTNTAGTLPNDRVSALFEDSSERIWACTDGGVCYYDYETDGFYPLIIDSLPFPVHAENIYEDGSGNLWLRNHLMIIRYNPDNRTFKTFAFDEYYFRSVAMTMTERGVPVFADALSLYVYNPELENFSRLLSIGDFRKNDVTVITTVKEIPQAGFFIGTDMEGLLLYHANTGLIETIIPEIHVRSILQYNENTYWIASESGIYIYNLIDRSIVNLRKSLTNDYALSDNAVYTLTKDSEGGVWAGSFFGGINYLPSNYTNFICYVAGKTHSDMLGNTIREICPDKYGRLWLSTEDNGINRFDPLTDEMVNYSPQNVKRQIAATNIHGLYAEGDTLWIGSFNKGIELMHIPTGKIFKRLHKSNIDDQLVFNFVLCFYRTRNGNMLLGTSVGAILYDERKGLFSRWNGINCLVRQFHEDRQGHIWVSTNYGLYKYTPSQINEYGNDTIIRYTAGGEHSRRWHNKRGQGLGSSNTTSIFEDSKGRIWITTAYGFSLYDPETDTFDRTTTDDGLPSNMVYRIVEDANGDFWLSTSNGLARFDPDTRDIYTYTRSDGLHETQFNYSSSYQAPNGIIYMGTVNGMIAFNPTRFMKDTHTPQLHITQIQMHDARRTNRYLLKHSAEPEILKLPHNASTFTISFIAPAYTSPDAIKYSYQLEGVDRDWIYINKNKEVTFAGLASGTYTFKVRSTNSNGVWQNNIQTLQIIITPPFWITIWAFLFYGLVVLVGLIGLYKYKKRAFIRKAQRNQELFETEKEKELYNAKIQFFTFITHEIRTPLTLIKAPLEKIISSGDGSTATKKHLQIIEKNTQYLLDLSNQLLDFRKTESRSFRLNFVKTDVTALLENILTMFVPVFRTEKKHFAVDWGNQRRLFAYIDRDAFMKIVTNLLTNALKYSEAYVSLALINADETFQIVVTNDGILIPDEDSENIFTPFYRLKATENIQGSGIGLSLSRTLAEFHNGTLSYSQTTEGRNCFTLALPVMQKGYRFDLTDNTEADNSTLANTTNNALLNRYVVLIVDDRNDMRRFIVDELRERYEVREAENGHDALNILSKHKIDIIISDIMMPVMDGFELCNAVKNDLQFSHIPFILLTAQHNSQSRLTGLNQGADVYMEKPFSMEHLFAQIENLLKNRETLRRAYQEKPLTPIISLAVSPLDDKFLKSIEACIEKNIKNPLYNTKHIAAAMNISESTLLRKVKALSGLTTTEFIRVTRLKKAVELLRSGTVQAKEAAYLVGFASHAYFTTCFRKQYGKLPSDFMKDNLE